MSAADIEQIITDNPGGALDCIQTLVGPTYSDQLAQAIMACIDEDAIKELIVSCLTNPETNPIDKQWLAEVIQGQDLDGDGTVGTNPAPGPVEEL